MAHRDRGERCLKILKLLQESGSVQVTNLSRKLDVSEMTIRRDLNYLSSQYNIQRSHGGAILGNQQVLRVEPFDGAMVQNLEPKNKIAAEAVKLLKYGQKIFIDSGSTVRLILKYIPKDSKIVIVTNNIKIAEQSLGMPHLKLILLGGEPMSNIYGCYGELTEKQLLQFKIDVAFLGACAVGKDGLIYDGYTPEARLKSLVFSVTEKKYLLADSSKFNTYDLHSFGRISQLDGVITDDGIDLKGIELIQRYKDVDLIIAK